MAHRLHPLRRWHLETFRVDWEAPWRGFRLVTFSSDAGGQVTRLQMDRLSFHRRREQP